MIEVIAIGNEILFGSTVNSNASFISQELLKEGYTVDRHTVLPDDDHLLQAGLNEALQRSRYVLCTGGLGPTCDDLTKDIAARLFDSPLHFSEEVAALLRERYGNLPISLENHNPKE